jgi:Raf kinase inhibitor-like YbhB/YbcL family protein
MFSMFRLTSPAFDDGQEMAQKYGKRARNVSPPLDWEDAPEGTRSFALSFVDVHPVARDYLHWLVSDISPQLSSLPEGVASKLSAWIELKPYVGPFPPSGTHDYEFTLYALSTDRLRLQPGVPLDAFRRAVAQNTLATATLIGKFTRLE